MAIRTWVHWIVRFSQTWESIKPRLTDCLTATFVARRFRHIIRSSRMHKKANNRRHETEKKSLVERAEAECCYSRLVVKKRTWMWKT
jgi:hypothetical protein